MGGAGGYPGGYPMGGGGGYGKFNLLFKIENRIKVNCINLIWYQAAVVILAVDMEAMADMERISSVIIKICVLFMSQQKVDKISFRI